MAESKFNWVDNPTASGQAICDTDVLNDCLMHLKYENGSGDLGNKITNCLLEVPQNIKLELADRTLTLKAGSKVIVPNGTDGFKEVVISADLTMALTTFTGSEQFMLFYNETGGLAGRRLASQVASGTMTPTTGHWDYYNTTDNYVYVIVGGEIRDYKASFPLGLITVTDGAITSIDQVFNGLGYIGGHIWVDKGVKFLQPNGINADGTLNNVERTTTKVAVTYVTRSNQRLNALMINTSLQPHPLADNNPYFEQDEKPNTSSQYYVWFDTKENLIKNTSDYGKTFATQYICCAGKASWVGGKVSQLVPKKPVRLLTYDDIKINNPYFFGQYIWSEFAPSNLSWLKSSGQWNSGSGYQGFYDWALANANAGKAGFKLSTASYTDYDFVVNTSAKTFRLPVKVQNAPMGGTAPVVGNGKVLGLTTDTGVNTGLVHTGVGGSKYLTGTSNNAYGANLSGTSNVATTDFGANGGLGVTTDPTNSGIIADLSKATNSNLSLYFYVGETVKDPTLIDVAQIASNFANKVEVVEAYSSGTSWYRVYSADQTGKRFCEQGGALSVGGQSVSVTLLKPYVDNTYNLTTSCNGAIDPKTVSNFVIDVNYGNSAKQGFDWRACGYIA